MSNSTVNEPITMPYTVLVDTREGAPYRFDGLRADADKQHRPLCVPWTYHTLATGDYSLAGFENRVTVERKSLEDLYSTLGQNRERFEREHQRMAEFEFAAVVVEADWSTILRSPPERSQLLPKTVFRTAISWSQRYGVHWLAMNDRRLAEVTTFRILHKFYVENKPCE